MYAELNEMLMHELAEDGYSGVEIRKTPMRTEIIIRATRTRCDQILRRSSRTDPLSHAVEYLTICTLRCHF